MTLYNDKKAEENSRKFLGTCIDMCRDFDYLEKYRKISKELNITQHEEIEKMVMQTYNKEQDNG